MVASFKRPDNVIDIALHEAGLHLCIPNRPSGLSAYTREGMNRGRIPVHSPVHSLSSPVHSLFIRHETKSSRYSFENFIVHLNDISVAEALSPLEIVFDENDITSLEEAVVSFQAALTTGERLLECAQEIDGTIAVRNSSDVPIVTETWGKWHDNVAENVKKLCAQMERAIQMFPADFKGSRTIVDDLKSSI